MKTVLYYFTGTGNSLKVAKDLAGEIGNTQIVPIPKVINQNVDVSADRIGIIFPVYMFGMPLIVVDFIKKIKTGRSKYIFAVATNGGLIANTLGQTAKQFKSQGMVLSAGFDVKMPGNYTPLYGAQPIEKQKKMFDEEKIKIKEIAIIVKEGRGCKIEKSTFLINLFFSFIYKIASPRIHKMDKGFWADDKCNSCGICEKVCPVKNIKINKGKPSWLGKCEQCFACLHWCPTEAIQYSKSTIGRKRYRHPEIKVEEIIIK